MCPYMGYVSLYGLCVLIWVMCTYGCYVSLYGLCVLIWVMCTYGLCVLNATRHLKPSRRHAVRPSFKNPFNFSTVTDDLLIFVYQIKIGETNHKAHRFVLASKSNYFFRRLVKKEMSDALLRDLTLTLIPDPAPKP